MSQLRNPSSFTLSQQCGFDSIVQRTKSLITHDLNDGMTHASVLSVLGSISQLSLYLESYFGGVDGKRACFGCHAGQTTAYKRLHLRFHCGLQQAQWIVCLIFRFHAELDCTVLVVLMRGVLVSIMVISGSQHANLLFLHGVLQTYSCYSESVTLLPLFLLMVLQECVE